MIKVLMFVGNEGVSPHNIVEVESFTAEALIPAIVEYYGKEAGWLDAVVDYVDDENYKIRNSFEIIGDTFAQVVEDPDEGGMIYVVRM